MGQRPEDSRDIDHPPPERRHRLAVDGGTVFPVDRSDPRPEFGKRLRRIDAGGPGPVDVQLPEDRGVQLPVDPTDRGLSPDRLEFPPVVVYAELEAVVPRDASGLVAGRD
jgi:hypothetical protein